MSNRNETMKVTIPILLPGPNGKKKIETIEVFDNCQQCGAQRYTVRTGKITLDNIEHNVDGVKATCGHRQNWTDLYAESETIGMLQGMDVNDKKSV